MIAGLIKFVLSNYSLSFFLIGLICAGISILRRGGVSPREKIYEPLLAYYCFMGLGVCNLYNFVMHVFFAPLSAHFISWANSPFQYEVGFASLGFGVVGLLAFRRDFGLRLAAVLGPAFFLWGAAGGHIYQMVAHRNFSPGNAGVVFWTDLFVPVVGVLFLVLWHNRSPTAHANYEVLP